MASHGSVVASLAIRVALMAPATIADIAILGALVVSFGTALLVVKLLWPYTVLHWQADLKFIGCEDCSGGAQWWNGDHWGPVPAHIQMMRAGGTYIKAPQANIRQCVECRGLGGFWVKRTPKGS